MPVIGETQTETNVEPTETHIKISRKRNYCQYKKEKEESLIRQEITDLTQLMHQFLSKLFVQSNSTMSSVASTSSAETSTDRFVLDLVPLQILRQPFILKKVAKLV